MCICMLKKASGSYDRLKVIHFLSEFHRWLWSSAMGHTMPCPENTKIDNMYHVLKSACTPRSGNVVACIVFHVPTMATLAPTITAAAGGCHEVATPKECSFRLKWNWAFGKLCLFQCKIRTARFTDSHWCTSMKNSKCLSRLKILHQNLQCIISNIFASVKHSLFIYRSCAFIIWKCDQ